MDPGFKQIGLFTALSAFVMLLFIASCGGGGNGATKSPLPPSWGTAELIGTDHSGNSVNPQIVFDASGNAFVVWIQYRPYNIEDPVPWSNIWVNYFNGKAWGTAELIGTDHPGNSVNPQIVFDASGNATVVWSQDDSSHTNIWINYFDGAAWGAAELIETEDNTWYPTIALDAAGNAIAVWGQYDGTRSNIWTKYFDGTTWGAAELIGSDDTGETYNLKIASDATGKAIVVWRQYDGTRSNIWANYFDCMAWGTAELIENDDGDADGIWSPQIAFDTAGHAIAAWVQYDGTQYITWANYFDGTVWGMAKLIGIEDAGDALSPRIAFDALGNAIVVWQQYDGNHSNIWANYFDGGAWGTAELIVTDDMAEYPEIAIEASGKAIVVWHHFDGIRDNLWATYFDGTAWGTAELIQNDDAYDARNPQIAFDANGNAIVVWQQWDGTRYNIWANYLSHSRFT